MKILVQHLVAGLAVGSLYAFMAVGVVLIFRSTRTLNFSHGMMATAGAFFLAILVDDHGWNSVLAFGAVVALGIFVGLLTYGVVGRPLVRATPLARTIATILWMLVMQGVMLLLIHRTQRAIPPLFSDGRVVVGGVALSRQSVGAILFTALSVTVLFFFFRLSRYGLAIRAVAEARRSAAVAGIPLLGVDALAWVLGGVTAVCGGALVGPFVLGDFFQLNLLLVRVLAAALVGGFVSLPGAVVGGVALGVGEQLLQGYLPGSPAVRELLPFLLVMVVVTGQSYGWFRRRAEGAGEEDVRVSSAATGGAPPSRGRKWLVAAGLTAAVLAPPLVGNASSFILGRGIIYGMVALSLVAVTGLSGQISLAQPSFMALGAYFGHYLIVRTDLGFWSVIPVLALLGAVAAAVLSGAAARARGLYLAIVTWTFGLVVDRVVLRWDWLVSVGQGGLHGVGGRVEANLARPEFFGVDLLADTRFVYVLLGFAVLAGVLVRNYAQSCSGLAVRVQRDDESAAVTSGLAVWRLRLGAFMLSGAIATVAGFLVLAHQGTVIPIEFNQFLALNFMLIFVLGGSESWFGALAAGVFYAFAPDMFERAPFVSGDWQFVVLGTLGIVLIAATEGGLAGDAKQRLHRRFRGQDVLSVGLGASGHALQGDETERIGTVESWGTDARELAGRGEGGRTLRETAPALIPKSPADGPEPTG